MNEKKNIPHAGRIGRIRYKVWENADAQGKRRYSIDIFRSIQSKRAGEDAPTWKDISSFSEEDLKLLPLLLAEVEVYLASQRSN